MNKKNPSYPQSQQQHYSTLTKTARSSNYNPPWEANKMERYQGSLFGDNQASYRLENFEIPRAKQFHGIPPYEYMKQKDTRKAQVDRKIKINVNKYRLKYDFEVARKINPIISGVTYHEEY